MTVKQLIKRLQCCDDSYIVELKIDDVECREVHADVHAVWFENGKMVIYSEGEK